MVSKPKPANDAVAKLNQHKVAIQLTGQAVTRLTKQVEGLSDSVARMATRAKNAEAIDQACWRIWQMRREDYGLNSDMAIKHIRRTVLDAVSEINATAEEIASELAAERRLTEALKARVQQLEKGKRRA